MELVKWPGIALLVWAIESVCCALAYRVHRGQKGLGISVSELVRKSMLVGFFFALVGVAGLAIASALELERRTSGIAIAYLVFVPIGAQVISWIFELDDWPAGLGIYFLRSIPALLIFVPTLFIR